MTPDHWLPGFLSWARRRGHAPHTLANQRWYLRLFAAFLEHRGIVSVCDVDRTTLAELPAHLMTVRGRQGRPLATATRALAIATVRLLFRYLIAEGHILLDPTATLKTPRVGHHLPKAILSAREMQRLLAAPDTASLWGLRDRTILEVLYGTGIRFSELVDLAVGDIDLDERVLWIRQGKGRRDRALPLGRWAAHWLRRYLRTSQPLRRHQRTERVFLTPRGNRLANWVINESLRAYAKAARITKHVTLHALRHTFATVLVQGGADVRHVQRLLGHAKLTTTQIYTHLELEDLRRVQDRCHPRERRHRRRGMLKES